MDESGTTGQREKKKLVRVVSRQTRGITFEKLMVISEI